MIRKRQWAFAVAALIIAGLSAIPGESVKLDAQRVLYQTLGVTAGIVAAVMGAWIALLYPKARDAVIKRAVVETIEDLRVKQFIQPLKLATAILTCSLVFGPVSEGLRALAPPFATIQLLRGFSFSLVVLLTELLCWAILLTMIPLTYAKGDIDGLREQQNAAARLRRSA